MAPKEDLEGDMEGTARPELYKKTTQTGGQGSVRKMESWPQWSRDP